MRAVGPTIMPEFGHENKPGYQNPRDKCRCIRSFKIGTAITGAIFSLESGTCEEQWL